MASAIRLPVEPSILTWARQSARLDVGTAADRIGVKADRIREWEAGDQPPTLNQLRKAATVYRRPLAAFFMSAPPQQEEPESLPDFRRASTRHAANPRALDDAMARAYRQRDALREIAADLEYGADETSPGFEFDGRATDADLGAELARVAGLPNISSTVKGRPEEAFRRIVRNVEAHNVNVMQVQRVPVKVMRGFSLGDGPCPVIALNGADWPRGKIFTLLHELAHIGFRSSGLCDLSFESARDLERRCDRIAAAALMPARAMREAFDDDRELTATYARDLGARFAASGEAAVLRLIELNLATWSDYRRLRAEFVAQYERYKAEEKETSTEDSPIFYPMRVRDLGRRFITEVVTAYGENALSSRDVASLLGVGFDKVPRLAETAGLTLR